MEVLEQFSSGHAQAPTIGDFGSVVETLRLGETKTAGNVLARVSKTKFAECLEKLKDRGAKFVMSVSVDSHKGPIFLVHISMLSDVNIDTETEQMYEASLSNLIQSFENLCSTHKGAVVLLGALQTDIIEAKENVYTISWKQRFGFLR